MRPFNTSAATLLFGPSKTGKSFQLAEIARYVAKHFGLRSLYFAFDEGGWPDDMQQLIDKGIVRVCRLNTLDPGGNKNMAMGLMDKAAKGFWPARVAKDGQVLSGSMLPPYTSAFALVCACGAEVAVAEQKKSLLPQPCPECKQMVAQGTGFVRETRKPAEHMKDIGAIFYDSIQGACAWCMDEHNYLSAVGKLGGSTDGRGGGRTPITSGGVTFGSAGMTSYGMIQMRPRDWSRYSSQIPGLVVPATWTSLDQRVTPDDQRPVVGPMLIGQAATGKAPAWFGNVINLANVGGQRRMYLQQWTEDDGKSGTDHLCGVRALAGVAPEYLADPAGHTGKPRECSMQRFFDLLDAARNKSEQDDDLAGIELPPAPEEAGDLQEFVPAPAGPSTPGGLPGQQAQASKAASAAPAAAGGTPKLPPPPTPKPALPGGKLPPPKQPIVVKKEA